jgi:hypothetical protein
MLTQVFHQPRNPMESGEPMRPWHRPHQLPQASRMSQRQEQRRKQAIDSSLAADPIADIGRHLACAQRGLYTWRDRYDAHHPPWAQERSTRPQSPPTHTPEHVARAVVSLSLPLRPHGTGGGGTAIRPALPQPGSEPIPARRTLSRIVRRHHTEGQERGSRAARVLFPGWTDWRIWQQLSTREVCCSSPAPAPHWRACDVHPVV